MPEMSFGRSVRYRRTKLGLSQARLGELVGRSSAAVRSWEKEASTPTDRNVLRALSAILGMEEEVIFEKAGVDLPLFETSPTVEEELGSLAPAEVATDEATSEPAVAEEPAVTEETEEAAEELGDVDEPEELEEFDLDPDWRPEKPVKVGPSSTIGRDQPQPSPGFAAPGQQYVYTMPASPVLEPSYMEDESQRQMYRTRHIATFVLVAVLIVTFLWALGKGWEEFTTWWDDFLSYLQV